MIHGMSQPPTGVEQQMRRALPAALKARDEVTVSALRSTLAAIENAEAVATSGTPTPVIGTGGVVGAASGVGATEVARRELSDREVALIVRSEITERQGAAAVYEPAGHTDHARRLRAEAAVLSKYLDTSHSG